jgi:transcriptional regulator with XRE-family HTH domain
MKRMEAERLARGWSKNRISQEAKLSPSSYSQIASGRLTPYPGQLAKIAAALGIDDAETDSLLLEAGNDADD